MKIKKLFLILPILTLLLAPTILFAAQECAWRVEMTISYPENGGSQTTGGCYHDIEQYAVAGQTCVGTPPEASSGGAGYARNVCCCPKVAYYSGDDPERAPKFEIPQLQINLTGLNLSQPTCTQGGDGEYICKINWLGEYITWVYNYALKVAGILAAIVLMAGGLLWLISGGDAGKVGQAKEMIVGAITGLIILLSSYILLITVNPELVKFRPITMGALSNQEVSELNKAKDSGEATDALTAGCATDQELKDGVNFYATGYCKPTWSDTKKFFCAIAMNCSCPVGVGLNTSENCDEFFVTLASKGKHYSPCNQFPQTADYCNRTSSGAAPYIGSIAGPNCSNLNYGDKVCFNGKEYTITDTGSAIQGKRIDIWTGGCAGASSVTGSGTLKKGACDKFAGPLTGTFNAAAWSFQTNIKNQAGDASPELGGLLNCMKTKLNPGVGVISSISDGKHIGDLSACNKAGCSTVACAHSCYSCHYGGGTNVNKSYAVDFGDENNMAALIAAAKSCDPNAYTLDEGNHLHVSSSACPKK
jgi:hypothetical protein